MRLEPLHNRLIVEREEAEDETPGGIIIPDAVKEQLPQGVVTAVGPGRRNEEGLLFPMHVSVGDKVLFTKYGGTEQHFEGKDFLILSEDDILAIVRED